MAHLYVRDELFYVRFRYQGKAYKKALKTRDKADAQAGLHGVEQTVHLLKIGQHKIPPGVDPGDFIVSGGTHTRRRRRAAAIPTLARAVEEYLDAQKSMIAATYLDSQRTHLTHLKGFLNGKVDRPLDRLTFADVDSYLQARLKMVNPSTVTRERNTLRRFGEWAVDREYVEISPAAKAAPIPCGDDLPKFRTKTEIEAIIERGETEEGDEQRGLWERLFLDPKEIGDLLRLVRQHQVEEESFLLHAIPAYTGMRRGEVLRARWLDVDLDGGHITAHSRKQSRKQRMTSREIDLHPELIEELRRWREQCPQGPYILCSPGSLAPLEKDRANRWFWQPMRRTDWCLNSKKNWFKVGFHTYRHSFASNLAARGVDPSIIDQYMGHSTEAMRKRYRHLFPKTRKAAIQCFSLMD